MESTPRARRRFLVGCSLIVAVAAASGGCAGGKPRTESEAKREFAQQIVDGGSVKMTDVKAKSYDPATYDLIDVEISDGERIIRAARAEILISREFDTVSLRLIDVVAADPTPGVEGIISMDTLTTDPIKLAYEVID